MELRADGVLHVKESVTLAGGPVQRKLITRTRYDDTRDRLYRISNVKGASFDGQTLTIAKSGTVEYDVTGAVTPLPGSVELRWFPVAGPRRERHGHGHRPSAHPPPVLFRRAAVLRHRLHLGLDGPHRRLGHVRAAEPPRR